MIEIIAFFIFFILGLVLLFFGVKKLRPNISKTALIIEYIIFTVYLLANLFFFIIYILWGIPYYKSVERSGNDYELLASEHILPIAVFYILFLASLFLVWTKAWKLPPIVILLCNCFLIIGVYISGKTLIQGSMNKEESVSPLLPFLPAMNISLAFYFFFKLMISKREFVQNRVYKNKIFNTINQLLSKSIYFYIAVLVFAFPVYYLITLILILFGQDSDAMTKVFTETTTWVYSQKEHPPYLDDTGHYLCTVAACGQPNLVKPLFIGVRHQRKIIVNRQLQIANAFEEIIQVRFPKIHYFIRKNYDNYGYNLSKKINNSSLSNITYILMKPLEWAFLTFIYTVSLEPEKLIKKQYNQFL